MTPAARLRDDPASTESAFAAALAGAEVLIVSGGVSVGPHDHVRPALSTLGVQERFWGVALQPGKPTWFGTRDRKLVFGLPGNPVSAVVTFALFAWPALAALQGAAASPAQPPDAELGEAVDAQSAAASRRCASASSSATAESWRSPTGVSNRI